MGANMPDVKALRDVEWYNLRRSCIKKYTDVQVQVFCCSNVFWKFYGTKTNQQFDQFIEPQNFQNLN